jgi:ribose 5-phosphate isomerase B
MKVYLATDHAGFALKETIKVFLQQEGYDIEDCGAYAFDANDDYPDFVHQAAKKVAQSSESRGIILGGSGQGEAMAANKVNGIRCGVFYTPVVPHSAADISGRTSEDPFEMVRLLREHNNANMLSLSGRFLKEDEAKAAIKLFLETEFSGEERHKLRI